MCPQIPPAPKHPNWPRTYQLSRSTVVYACNYSGWFDPVFLSRFAVVGLDWSNAKAQWTAQHPMHDEESDSRITKIAACRVLAGLRRLALSWTLPASCWYVEPSRGSVTHGASAGGGLGTKANTSCGQMSLITMLGSRLSCAGRQHRGQACGNDVGPRQLCRSIAAR